MKLLDFFPKTAYAKKRTITKANFTNNIHEQFYDLPLELWVEIISYLTDPKDLANIKSLNRNFYTIALSVLQAKAIKDQNTIAPLFIGIFMVISMEKAKRIRINRDKNSLLVLQNGQAALVFSYKPSELNKNGVCINVVFDELNTSNDINRLLNAAIDELACDNNLSLEFIGKSPSKDLIQKIREKLIESHKDLSQFSWKDSKKPTVDSLRELEITLQETSATAKLQKSSSSPPSFVSTLRNLFK